MTVKLVSYSQPTEEFAELGIEDAQDLIAFCARVSNPSNQYNTDTSDKLINYLIKHKHFSPLEMVSACIEVETTRDIARQLLRHRSFSFQEFSQRYADPTKDLNFVTREARFQDTKNRQNSIVLDFSDPEHRELSRIWEEKQQEVIRTARESYNWAIRNGIAKEQARAVLPEGLTESRLYVNGTIRSWIHFIEVRTEESTQKEHRELALECAKAISRIFPLAESYVYKKPEIIKIKPVGSNWFKRLCWFFM
jgi:thymidylate synthase (FAD)